MCKAVGFSVLVITFAAILFAAERKEPASESELAQITIRGKQLAAYDTAAEHAADAVLATKPDEGKMGRYVARMDGPAWVVAFGRLNEKRDAFLVAYEALQGATPTQFNVRAYDPPRVDKASWLFSALAVDTVSTEAPAGQRPYNVAVLPATSGQFYVYLMPAQTAEGVFPLGGDTRYLVSKDGTKIVERRRLHESIIEFSARGSGLVDVQSGFHTAVLDDIPEDTDVFHVLVRKPAVQEWVLTRKYVYLILPDGAIRYVMTAQAFEKVGKQILNK